jgi:hypothetical protein
VSIFVLYNLLFADGEYINISEEGSWGPGWHRYKYIVVRGNYAYTTIADGLEIIDISNPAKPLFVSQYRIPGIRSWVETLAIKDNYAYLAGSPSLLTVVDISDLRNPKGVATVHTHDAAGQLITISGHYAYVADWFKGLFIIDIFHPEKPFISGYYNLKEEYNQVTAMHIKDNLAILNFSLDDEFNVYQKVKIVDISNPYEPVELGGLDNRSYLGGFVFVGKYAYTSQGYSVVVYDLSNPVHPKEIARVATLDWITYIGIQDQYIYVNVIDNTNDHNYIQVISTSNPEKPEILYTTKLEWREDQYAHVFSFDFEGNHMFLLEGAIMHVLDISNPLDIKPVTTYSNSNLVETTQLEVKGNYAYIRDYYTGFGVLDISDPANPYSVFSENKYNHLFALEHWEVRGDYLYQQDNSTIFVYDISNPAAPERIHWFIPWNLNFITFEIYKNYAYLTNSKGFMIFNISDRRNWKNVGEVAIEDIGFIQVFGDYAYIKNGDGLEIMDLSNPEEPVTVGSTTKSALSGKLIKKGNYLFSVNKNHLIALDISDPSDPGPETQFDFGYVKYSIWNFTICGDYAIISSSDHLIFVDISNPLDMKLLGYYPKPANFKYIQSGIENGDLQDKYFYTDKDFHVYKIIRTAIAPQMNVTPRNLSFTRDAAGNTTGPQSFKIDNPGQADSLLYWRIESDKEWLGCFPYSGIGSQEVTVSVDSTMLTPGAYRGTITVGDVMSRISPQQIAVTLTVYGGNQGVLPFGDMGSPAEGKKVSGSIAVAGWALDNLGIQKLEIYRETRKGTLAYIGDASFVPGARPDVAAAFPHFPNNDRAGWGYMMLTHTLPNRGNGPLTIHAIAVDSEGNAVTLGTRTVFVDNKNAVIPFGTIDTPAQGAAASGNKYLNWGWALTPQPNLIPEDGSTIDVWVDGVNLGHPVYNIYREDIATLFPGYANSNGAVGYFYLDTTKYANGLHTIQWTVKDSAGNSDGIGSRYFSIDNAANGAQAVALQRLDNVSEQVSTYPIDRTTPVGVRKGYELGIEPQWLFPGEDGTLHIEVAAMSRLEINLPPGTSSLLPLPVGAGLDENGTFSWQIGAGFLGPHRLFFLLNNPNSTAKKPKLKEIIVNILQVSHHQLKKIS